MDKIIVTDIKMPFMSMVVFMVKWTFATIPAIIIIAFLVSVPLIFLSALGIHHVF